MWLSRAPPGPARQPRQQPVGRRVEREQHQVVRSRRPDEPDQTSGHTGSPSDERGSRGEREQASTASRWPGRAVDARPGGRITRSGTRSSATHLVQCTPGSAGTITRAGKPWSGDEVDAVDPQGEQRVAGRAPGWLQRRRAERARRVPASARAPTPAPARRRARPGRAAVRRSRSAGRPALDAGDRQRGGVLRHRQQRGAVEADGRGHRRSGSAASPHRSRPGRCPAPRACG